jgi:wyosine [tRNA(Phe)-imidazoG37] synthetase (radical SAM superfamily)
MPQLSIRDHRRDVAGMTYVYPVVSRRAGGVSVGINLNPNNACNWRCIYCQVPNLTRGGPPPIDLTRLEAELRDMLDQLYVGDYLARHAPLEARRVVDVAFSGNGEPTSAPEFSAAVDLVLGILESFSLPQPPKLRLITNGSLLDRPEVQAGIAAIGAQRGEVWFKVDAVESEMMHRINGVSYAHETVRRRLSLCAELCETWVQTCCFAVEGEVFSLADSESYMDLLRGLAHRLAGVFLYGLARPSMQAEAALITSVPPAWLEARAEKIRHLTGLTVHVSP